MPYVSLLGPRSLDQLQQHRSASSPRSARFRANAILLSDHDRPGERPRHALGPAGSSPARPSYGPVGEEQIDEHAGLGVLERAELRLDRAHGLQLPACGPSPAAASSRRVAHAARGRRRSLSGRPPGRPVSTSWKTGLSVVASRAPPAVRSRQSSVRVRSAFGRPARGADELVRQRRAGGRHRTAAGRVRSANRRPWCDGRTAWRTPSS